jgi:hypothetical protein
VTLPVDHRRPVSTSSSAEFEDSWFVRFLDWTAAQSIEIHCQVLTSQVKRHGRGRDRPVIVRGPSGAPPPPVRRGQRVIITTLYVMDSYFMVVTGTTVFGPAWQVTAPDAGQPGVRGGPAGRPASPAAVGTAVTRLRPGNGGRPGYVMPPETGSVRVFGSLIGGLSHGGHNAYSECDSCQWMIVFT